MNPKFSVIITTHNRINDLKDTLNSLEHQTYPQNLFEVIIVDAGTKNFHNIVEEFQNLQNFKFILNTKLGISIQRNIGIESSTGEFVIFIDDDANAEPNWLEEYNNHLNLEKLGVLAGRIRPLWGSNVKNYHKKSDYIKNLYSIYDLGEKIKEVEYGFGCNILLRKSALEEIGNFDLEQGKVGNDSKGMLYGEDVLSCIIFPSVHFLYQVFS